MLDINKLIESDIDQVREIGWIFYNTDINAGLNEDDTYKVIKLLSEIETEEYTEMDLEKSYEEGYDEGYDAAKEEYQCDCDCEE